jgi:predicted MFS family arabinose efflux permease
MSFQVKISYLVALVIFELGSLVCGIAPNSTVLIIGRAVQGLGSAGIITGSFVIIGHCVPMVKRPVYFASAGLMFGVGAITGSIFGGIFTDLVTWRWCFYFKLPIGGATMAVLLFFFKAKEQPSTRRPFFKRVAELDHVGTLTLLGGFVMFFLALQYGEEMAGWGSAMVIGLLVGALVTFILFAVWEWWMKDAALIPIRIATQRTVVASCLSAIFIYGVMLIHGYYLPIWFQAIRGTSALQSGVSMIPYMIANALCTLSAGIVVSKTGYFTPPAIIGCAIAVIGCGLVSTLSVDISTAKWVGYEILASGGLGIAVQIGFTGMSVLPLYVERLLTFHRRPNRCEGGANLHRHLGHSRLSKHGWCCLRLSRQHDPTESAR